MVDILIILSLFLYVLSHIGEGFLALTRRLAAFLGSILLAFAFYKSAAGSLSKFVDLTPGIMESASFVLLFIIFQMLISYLLEKIFSIFPEEVHTSRISKLLAVAPALIDGVILVTLVLLILVAVPVLPTVKKPIEESKVGNNLLNRAGAVEVYIDKVFGQAAQETLGFLTVKPESDETLTLPFKPSKLAVDESAEAKMLELINMERAKEGIGPVVIDQTIIPVARAHSTDMWQRSYFAHENPDGESPFDRMREGNVRFRSAGENLALARTVERAHTGLMNSPGHRRNIMDPSFTRIGIGVIDGGIYGKMFTQNFAD